MNEYLLVVSSLVGGVKEVGGMARAVVIIGKGVFWGSKGQVEGEGVNFLIN